MRRHGARASSLRGPKTSHKRGIGASGGAKAALTLSLGRLRGNLAGSGPRHGFTLTKVEPLSP
jgi:hypothetical protein